MSSPAKQLNALAPDSLVLVTGANGYLASHIIDQVLAAGHRVRGTVRATKPWLDELFTKRHGAGRYESVVVPDLSVQADVEKAVEGVDGVILTASILSFSPDPNEVVPPVIAFTELLLKVAAATPSVKRVVLTSSSIALLTPVAGKKGVRVDENSWNEEGVKAAWDPNTPAEIRPMAVYAASKTQGEQAAWKFVSENKPDFVLNAVLPNLNTGEILHKDIAGSSQGFVNGLLAGNDMLLSIVGPQFAIDVKDTARLHVIALAGQDVENQRIFGLANNWNHTDLLDALKRLRPDNTLIPAAPENEERDLTDVVPAKKAEQLLKDYYGQDGWTGFEESLKQGIANA